MIVMMMFLLVACEKTENISGYYEGSIHVNGQELFIEIDLDVEETLAGTINIPSQGISKLPLSRSKIKDKDLEFEIHVGSQVGFFKGKYKADEISGTFEQNGAVFDFDLKRVPLKVYENRTTVEINVDDRKLTGELIVAEQEEKMPVALIIAGSGPTDMDGNNVAGGVVTDSYLLLAEALEEKGISTLRYNKGFINNPMNEASLRFEDLVDDAVLMIDYLNHDERFSEIILIGHSQGALVAQLASLETDVDKVVILAGAGRRIDLVMKDQLMRQLDADTLRVAESILKSLSQGQLITEIPESLSSLFRDSIQPFLISWMAYDPLQILNMMTTETLVISGSQDSQVNVSEAERLRTSSNQVTYQLIENMNHVLKNVKNETENLAAYQNKDLPIHEVLVEALEKFIQ